MKYFYILFIVGLLLIHTAQAQQLERITNSLPVFAASSNISAANGILTIGVFSDASTVNQNNLELIRTLKTWNSKLIKKAIPHKKIEVTALDDTNIAEFKGQIIWVIDGDSFSLEKIKIHTNNGVFTIGTQELAFENYLFATLIYKNKSDDPKVEKWRLIKLIANCEISPLRFTKKLSMKEYFIGEKCD